MLIISVVLGLAVTALAVAWVSQKGSIASNKVVVAAMDIELGTRLNPQMLRVVDWPSGSVPPGAFDDLKNIQDRVVQTRYLGDTGGIQLTPTDLRRGHPVGVLHNERVDRIYGISKASHIDR